MKTLLTLPALAVALVMAACSTTHSPPSSPSHPPSQPPAHPPPHSPSHPSSVGLTGTTWQLEELNGRDSIGHKASLTVSREGRMGGNSGCNTMFGHAAIAGNRVTFETIGSTKMACTDDGIMEQERRYFAALKQVATWRVDGGKLYLTNRAGKDVLVYEVD